MDLTHCRSKWGFCGSSSNYCNEKSTWTRSGCSSPAQGSCAGEPCSDASLCRSKWGYCGSGSVYCNAESVWTAQGCLSLLSHRREVKTRVAQHRFLGTNLIQSSYNLTLDNGLPIDEL